MTLPIHRPPSETDAWAPPGPSRWEPLAAKIDCGNQNTRLSSYLCDFHPKNKPFQRCEKKQCEQLNPKQKTEKQIKQTFTRRQISDSTKRQISFNKKNQFAIFLQKKHEVVVSNIFLYVHPYFGNMIQFDELGFFSIWVGSTPSCPKTSPQQQIRKSHGRISQKRPQRWKVQRPFPAPGEAGKDHKSPFN